MASTIHDQAMRYIYKQVLERVLDDMSRPQRAALQLLVQRLVIAAGGPDEIARFRVFFPYSGDDRASHALACLRAAQLSLASQGAATFALRVLLLPRGGHRIPSGERLERCFSRLFLEDDPRAELLMVDGGHVVPFCARRLLDPQLDAVGRERLLTLGHLCHGRPERVLEGWHVLAQTRACRAALDHEGPVDVLATELSLAQQRRLLAWSQRCRRAMGLPDDRWVRYCARSLLDNLAQVYEHLPAHCLGVEHALTQGDEPVSNAPRLQVVDLADLLPDDPTQATASDPEPRHGSLEPSLAGTAILTDDPWREEAYRVFLRAHALSPQQLDCLLSAPFVGRGAGLEAFVKRCYPEMRVALPLLHQTLQGRPCPEAAARWLTTASGLPISTLQALYADQGRPQGWRHLFAHLAWRQGELPDWARGGLAVDASPGSWVVAR